MVTCNMDSVSKVSRPRRGSSVSSGFRLLDADQCDNRSSVSRNSIYKLKIDKMFDETVRSNGRSSARRRSSSIHGGSSIGVKSNADEDNSGDNESTSGRVKNSVQAQIEKMFSDVAKDAPTTSFAVRCLGSLPLKDKVTSLVGLQEPLRQLYLSGAGHGNQNAGALDICQAGLRVRLANGREPQITPFPNIAVWSAVKFVVSSAEGGAAFLPLITDPENIDKSSLFRPLSAADKRRLSSGLHSPLFAVVLRSGGIPKQLECHGFVCQTPEDAIVIAATLYQSLMSHMGSNQNQKTRRPKNRNGIGCVSIASSQATTNLVQSVKQSVRRSNSQRSSIPPPSRQTRKKRCATSSLSGESDTLRNVVEESSTEERNKKKSSKSKRAPPIPTNPPPLMNKSGDMYNTSMSYLNDKNRSKKDDNKDPTYAPAAEGSGDILTRVAIPRSGSFLNTAGLTRYKSRATRRHTGKSGGGGGSPLGFSELFNEFRLQENLHSLDEILNAIINSDGMSFNDLKPIYKEFLLKLAVTLTKDELYQRSKSIMRRQKKKKLRRKNSNAQPSKRKRLFIGAKGLKKVFKFGKFRSKKTIVPTGKQITKHSDQSSVDIKTRSKKGDRSRIATSGSEVSEVRNEHTLNGHNRNSSSGYVSCSECSYDSDACTCVSADRCYCSLGGDEINDKLRKAGKRESLPYCQTEDKCYCSMGETAEGEGSTTWCDSDSCASISKCYCQTRAQHLQHQSQQTGGKSRGCKDNLALDYELFTVGGNGRHVKPAEALSVKKSVEMAAVFADVKLSQTTDITNLKSSSNKDKRKSNSSLMGSTKSKGEYIFKSSQSDLILRKDQDKPPKRMAKSEGYYQAIAPRPVSTSLEDSLGYLP